MVLVTGVCIAIILAPVLMAGLNMEHHFKDGRTVYQQSILCHSGMLCFSFTLK